LPDEQITISRRPDTIVCTGHCPHREFALPSDDVTVWPDGRVLVVREPQRPWTHDIQHFRVSTAEAAQFRKILLRYRDGAEHKTPKQVDPEAASFLPRPCTVEIRWSRHDNRDQMVACPPDPALAQVVRRALSTVHLYYDASRRR
jgi:hypothetical protein